MKLLLITSAILGSFLMMPNLSHSQQKHIHCGLPATAGISGIACDLCGCYLGPDPNYNFNTAGIRYKLRRFSGDEMEEQNTSEQDHAGHQHGEEETYNTAELWSRYYLSPKLQLFGIIPVSSNLIGDEKFSGAGDIQLQAKYQIFNTEVSGETKFRNRLFLGGGIKFPTGRYNIADDSGAVEAHFQPGTGSFDFLLLGSYFAKSGNLGFAADAAYKINTENSNKYLFGDQLNLNGVFTYDIPADAVTLIPYAGVYFEYSPEDRNNGATDPNSGGSALLGNFGLDLTAGMFTVKLNYQPVFTQSLNGDQPQNDYRFVAGLGYSFGF